MSDTKATTKAHTLAVEPEFAGQRIDNFLINRIKGVPRSYWYRVVRRGEVRVNKGRVKPSYRLRAGDAVRIPPTRASADEAPIIPPALASRLAARIIYEDERLIAVDKPAGLAVHGGSGISAGLIESMRAARPELTALELVHRLDRDTSGCILLAKRPSALREVHRLIRTNAVDKRYLALVCGQPPRTALDVTAPLRKNVLAGGERIVRVDPLEGKDARTRFRTLGQYGRWSLVEAALLTGRTHQIRVHAAHLHLPIAGDDKYGSNECNREVRELGLNRMFLHAAKLRFKPEWREHPLAIAAPLPEDLLGVIERLGGLEAREAALAYTRQ